MPEQHINTFNKGMTSDMNIMLQPDGTYRFMKNCQLISQDGNNYVIKDCLGNTKIFTINIPYTDYVGRTHTVTFGAEPMIIGFISFPDRLIVLSTNDETEAGDYGEIGEIKYDPYGEGIQPKANSPTNTYSGYVPLYHHKSLKFTKLRRIEGFAFNENDVKQRIYWTDNLNEPRVFDVGDSTFTTYIASGSLVVGQQYMVLEGLILENNGYIYSPDFSSDPSPLAPNVFTATATTYTDQFGSGNVPTTAKVIKYYPYQLLNFTPSRSLGNIKFNSYGTGTVLCGAKMYFYRLSDPVNGVYTSWSYGSSPIPVITTNSVVPNPFNTYFENSGGGTSTQTLSSGRSVKIDINNIDTNFVNIQMAVAEFDQLTDVPRLISIVVDTAITGSSMTLEHTGGANLGTLSLTDITLFPASILTCKTMATDKNYILIGNIKERSEFSIDLSAVTITDTIQGFPVHQYDPTSCSNVLNYTDVSADAHLNPGLILKDCQYVVVFGDMGANQVIYNGTNYITGQVITGVLAASAITINGIATVYACASRNRYTTNASVNVPDVITLPSLTSNNKSFWSYKSPVMASHKLGYWCGETYRFGVLFYDLKGNPMYVRWIGDKTIPNVKNGSAPLSERITGIGYDLWYLNRRGISISGLTIPASIIDQISGFSIVRADRDKKIITEGILMQTGGTGTWFKSMAGPNPKIDSEWQTSVNNGKNYTYICPDDLVSLNMTNYAPGSFMEDNYFIDPTDYSGGGLTYRKSTSNDHEFESRYLAGKAWDSVNRKQKIVAIQTVNEADSITNFGSANLFYWGNVKFDTLATSLVNGACIPSAAYQTKSYAAEAGRRSVVELDGNPLDYGGATGYGDLVNAGLSKMLVDVTVDKTNPYGGNSPAAKANTLYISTGHFQPINAQVKSDTLDINGNYTFNNVEIWGGDCFTCLIDYGHSVYDNTIAPAPPGGSHSWGLKFPCQCNTNYDLRRGRTIANNGMHNSVNGVSYSPARLESFSYNPGYSSFGIEFAYPALPVNVSFASLFRYRIRFAGTKFPNELVNSFRNFFTNDYKDIDGQGGEINNIKVKDGRVIVWQNAITSTVPILERQLLTGLAGAATTLGTGGVVDRYDPLNSYFGNQHQWGLTPTEFGFIWFDMRRKALVILSMNEGLIEISNANGVSGFFNEVFVDNLGSTVQTTPINSPTFDKTSDRPLVGIGITGVYDPKFKMSYMTFKFRNYPATSMPLARDFTIGYHHVEKVIVGFYDWTPAIAHNHNQIVLACNNPKNKTVYFGVGMASFTANVGDVVAAGNSEYLCKTGGNILFFTIPPSGGGSVWTKINTTNEVWVNNQPSLLGQSPAPDYLYNSFFGQVIDNEIDFVVNPKTGESFTVMNMEQHGNNVYPTTLTVQAESQTATESVRSTSVNWKYIYDKICHNVPTSLTGRITNSYLLVKFIKRNWTTDPAQVTGSPKILQFVKSLFTLKR